MIHPVARRITEGNRLGPYSRNAGRGPSLFACRPDSGPYREDVSGGRESGTAA